MTPPQNGAVFLDLMAHPSSTSSRDKASSASGGTARGGLVVEQTLIVKTILVDGIAVSKKALVLEPVRVRDLLPGENHYPTPPDTTERRQVGIWRRMVNAIKKYGHGNSTT
jgi:hypothetical protein